MGRMTNEAKPIVMIQVAPNSSSPTCSTTSHLGAAGKECLRMESGGSWGQQGGGGSWGRMGGWGSGVDGSTLYMHVCYRLRFAACHLMLRVG